jgi:flagellin
MSLVGGGTAVTVTATIGDSNDLSALLSAINTVSGTTGVTAEFDGTDRSALILRENDGDDITIDGFLSSVNLSVSRQSNYEGTSFATGSAVTLTGATATTDSTRAVGVVRMESTKDFTAVDTATTTAGYLNVAATTTAVSADLSKVSEVGLGTRASASSAIGVLDTAIQAVNESRGSLGAVSNRLDSTMSNLANVAINLEDGRSRIEDADFAQESANLAKQQIMLQAGTAMLAQANASQQNVLSLLG